ncbi:MAG: hypothetical protein K2F71_01025 [Paramuribaculum sp.]|nr:hypothetical protein [Paramuribaculum sp.]
MKGWVLAIILGLSLMLFSVCSANRKLTRENERLNANNTALMDRANYYETEAGKSAASVQKLELTYSELERNYQDVCQTADDLNIKVKRLQAAAKTATQTEIKVITEIRDSIVYRDGLLDSLKVLRWQDPWVSVAGEIRGRDVELDVVSCDTIKQIIHRVPKRFWFIKWGCKAIRQEVVSSNPHTKITYTEYIELK